MTHSTTSHLPPFYFDRKDHDLLRIVEDILEREDLSGFKHLLTPYLHPRGVKELAASQGLRMAYAAAHLLGSLEIGKAHDRLDALRALKDEVMNASVTNLRLNTARALLQIMKELVRSRGDTRRQLELAHDFRMAATGKARIIAQLLDRYHLVLMPEDWAQVSFDNHVHDANTKGRKTATHLIMDAWIKGIRHLTVIYYNFVPVNAAEELMKAAKIMGITVRIGIESVTRLNSKAVKIIWVPRGFSGSTEFLAFLRQEQVAAFMAQGQALAKLQEEQILHVLDQFNSFVLPDFNSYFGIGMVPASRQDFLDSVGAGQASLMHLGKYLHGLILPQFLERLEALRAKYRGAPPGDRPRIEGLVEEMNALDAETLADDYLADLVSSDKASPMPAADQPLYCCLQTPQSFADTVSGFKVGSRLILDLAGLDADDVLETLHATGGRISHLEMVNLKNCAQGNALEPQRMAALLQAVNAPSVMALKRWVLGRVEELAADASPKARERETRMRELLKGVPALHASYRDRRLRTSLGSDSTGQSCRGYGMGMVVRETLPLRARHSSSGVSKDSSGAMTVSLAVEPSLIFEPRESTRQWLDSLYAKARSHPALRFIGYKARREFKAKAFSPCAPGKSNILIMGGVKKGCGNHFSITPEEDGQADRRKRPAARYCNSSLKNGLMVLAGFIPACLTFLLTKDWWVLAWFGGLMWFGITGLRNIIQSVLGGGGFSRTPLLKWNDYVSWGRLCESLFYTGFSVPLLDWLVKTVLLDHSLGITVANSPATLYTVMAMVNGLYICAHNLFRGLPRQAAAWNLLRSAFSIPLAMAFSAALGYLLAPGDPAAAGPVLQQWAAVISKLASDCVAGVIEGLADRENNMRQRLSDYKEKIVQTLAVHEKLEVFYPTLDMLGLMADPKSFVNTVGADRPELVNAVIVNSLDYLYFWMYQPRGRSALARVLKDMDAQTRQVFLLSQHVLARKREISQLFLDGLLGRSFSKGLAFYLDYADSYLEALSRTAGHTPGQAPQAART